MIRTLNDLNGTRAIQQYVSTISIVQYIRTVLCQTSCKKFRNASWWHGTMGTPRGALNKLSHSKHRHCDAVKCVSGDSIDGRSLQNEYLDKQCANTRYQALISHLSKHLEMRLIIPTELVSPLTAVKCRVHTVYQWRGQYGYRIAAWCAVSMWHCIVGIDWIHRWSGAKKNLESFLPCIISCFVHFVFCNFGTL